MQDSASQLCNQTRTDWGILSQALPATQKLTAFAVAGTVADFTAQMLAAAATTSTTTTGLSTAPPMTTASPTAPIYLCAFSANQNCQYTGQTGCQQLPINRCHGFSDLPPQLGLSTVYAKVVPDASGTYTAGVFPNPDCTGTIVGQVVQVTGASLGQCDHYTIPGFGNVLDFSIVSACPLCVPDPALSSSSSSSRPTAGSTSRSSSTSGAMTTAGPAAAPSAGRGKMAKAVVVGAVVGVVCASLAAVAVFYVYGRRKHRAANAPYRNIRLTELTLEEDPEPEEEHASPFAAAAAPKNIQAGDWHEFSEA